MEAASIPESPTARPPRPVAKAIADNILWLLMALALLFYFIQDPQADARRRQDGPVQRHDLGAHRAGLHARLRHHRADQLRPRRGLHDRLVRLGVDLADARRHSGQQPHRDPRIDAHRDRPGDAGLRDAQRDDRAGGLQATAQRAQAGAAHHRDRHELHPAERRPAVARAARQLARPHRLPEGLLHGLRRGHRALRRVRRRHHRPAAHRARLVRGLHPLRQGDARHRPGSRRGAAHGHQRGPHDLADLPARRACWPARPG